MRAARKLRFRGFSLKYDRVDGVIPISRSALRAGLLLALLLPSGRHGHGGRPSGITARAEVILPRFLCVCMPRSDRVDVGRRWGKVLAHEIVQAIPVNHADEMIDRAGSTGSPFVRTAGQVVRA